MSGFAALTVYQLDKAQLSAITADALKKHAFRDAPGEAKSWGWTSIDDLTDTEWLRSVPEKGEFMAFSLRVDTKKVPAPVLKLHLQKALLAEEAKNAKEGKEFVSRARKKELKELHTSKLLSKAEAVPATIDVAIDTATGLMHIGSTSKSALTLLAEHLEKSFKITPDPLASKLTNYALLGDELHIISDIMEEIYNAPQSVNIDGQQLTVRMSETEAISLVAPEVLGGALSGASGGASGGASSSINSKATPASVEAGLQQGMKITKIQLQTGEEPDICTFTWNNNFTFSGIKTPARKPDPEEDPDAAFLEKMYLTGRIVDVMFKLSNAR